MTKSIRKVIGIVLAASLILTAAGCSRNTNPVKEQLQETQAEDQISESAETDEYDISSNLQVSVSGDEKAIDTAHFTITLTHEDSWDYVVDSKTSITIYNTAAKEANCGGRLVSITAYDPGDKSYEVLPEHCVIGEADGKLYIAEYPSDVQFDPVDEETAADYQAVFKEVNNIRARAEDSPIVLK